MFDATTKELLNGFLQDRSCLILAYGVTGSGKTYTILGPEQCVFASSMTCRNPGLVPRALQYIITGMQSPEFRERHKENLDSISLELSLVEDYQDNAYDLLTPSTRIGQNKPALSVRSDAQGFLHIKDRAVWSPWSE